MVVNLIFQKISNRYTCVIKWRSCLHLGYTYACMTVDRLWDGMNLYEKKNNGDL